MSRSILIIDDDRELCDLVGELLRAEGFEVEAHHSGTGAVDKAASGRFALVILDVMLPGQNGFEILRALRQRSAVPVILLTARGEDVDRIVGLEIGADDYLPKPFNSRELTARIHAVLRRIQPRGQDTLPRVAVGDVTLDPATRTVTKNDAVVELTTVEFDLLRMLLETAGRVVTREDLSERVLGRAFDPFDRSIDVHVGKVSSSGPRSTHVPANAFSHFMFHVRLVASYVRRFMPSTISSPDEPVILYSSAIA